MITALLRKTKTRRERRRNNNQFDDDSTSTTTTETSISTAAIENIIEKLKTEKHRSSTKRTYYGIWRSFNEFYIKLDRKPRTWEERLVLFVGYLIDNKRQSNTIKTYISAIRSVLVDDGITLNENKVLLTSLTKACKLKNDQVKHRFPIRKGLLEVILREIQTQFLDNNQPYLAIMYKALYATAYYGLFRASEVTTGAHPIQARDVHIGENKNKMMFVLR